MYTTPTTPGQRRGRLLGYPTINLVIPAGLDAKHGIYAGTVTIKDTTYIGAFHYGPIPTFDSPEPTLEVFVLDESFDYLPERVSFQLLHYLRPVIAFKSQQALTDQIAKDVEKTRELVSIK